jgi:hypothetical protein
MVEKEQALREQSTKVEQQNTATMDADMTDAAYEAAIMDTSKSDDWLDYDW